MELLFSNNPPLRTDYRKFSDTFYDQFEKADACDIAVGYVTAESLSELQNTIRMNTLRTVNLTIGMHYFEKFTRLEYQAATDLNAFLSTNHLGGVRLVDTFRFHGKMYTFSKEDECFSGIIGSNNLSSIVETVKTYEASVLLSDKRILGQMKEFILRLNREAAKPLDTIEIDSFKEIKPILANHDHVRKASDRELAECLSNLTEYTFQVPVKTEAKSGLNAFFGKGRESPNGLVKSRHWYEAEIIVSNTITSQRGYPIAKTEDSEFDVITDDGWMFRCKVSGDYSKNLRSEGDLKILGMWLKGRMEQAGVLKVGQLITDDILNRYGRRSFSFTKTAIPQLWYLDFGVV